MKILAIETSCDETAISILEARGGFKKPQFKALSHTVASQIAIHKEWGGVVPSIAKREHGKAAVPLLKTALEKAGLWHTTANNKISSELLAKALKLLPKEPDLAADFVDSLPKLSKPKIDALAVTQGPGLEPALWVGINFARALSVYWQIPLIPVNHLEGHLFSSLLTETTQVNHLKFPAIALLASGGHTEIILVKDWLRYKTIGRTRDDAVGEAFDKVARLLDLPYPGGPEIARLAEQAGDQETDPKYRLPRPMLHSGDFDFSFSGLKTAVLYLVKKISPLSEQDKIIIAHEFQTAALDVLLAKTLAAVGKYQAQELVVGGGVIANEKLKQRLQETLTAQFPSVTLKLPSRHLSTDNATMIAVAAYFRSLSKTFRVNPKITASGNLSL